MKKRIQISYSKRQKKEMKIKNDLDVDTPVYDAKDVHKLIYKTDIEEFKRQLANIDLTKKLPF